MGAIRVHELAKELGISSSEILEKMEKIGFPAKSHMASLDHQQAERVRNFYRPVEIIEKRITPGIIRRRAKVEEIKVVPKEEVPAPAKEVAAPLAEMEAKISEAPSLMEEVKIAAAEPEPAPIGEQEVLAPSALEKVTGPAKEMVAEPTFSEVAEKVEPKRVELEPGEGERTKEAARREGLRAKERLRWDAFPGRKQRPFKPAVGFKPRRPALVPVTPRKKTEVTVPKAIKRVVEMVETITVADLAKRMGVKASEVIKKLLGLGVMGHINYVLDMDTATVVAQDFGFEIKNVAFEPEEVLGKEEEVQELVSRPPVVTVMGHVDHGKTSLLDAIRESNVVSLETGGITQHIGAYQVKLDKGQVTFLDTPGHEAFTAMRARGAKVTDIVVLVVAADDGVMPQTIEAIDHARAAQVPIIVAINKIDKPGADPHRVRQGLSDLGFVPEEWGGNTIFVEVSAKKRIGLKELLEYILLQAEVLELKARAKKMARGTIIEAELDKGRGPVATVLVQEGTLHPGEPFVCGQHFGRVRAMYNEWGRKVDEATPSQAVEVLGISGVPEAGDLFRVVADEKKAKEVGLFLRQKQREKELSLAHRLTLEELYSRAQRGEVKELNLIIKADVQGSVEALRDSLIKLSTEAIKLKVIHSAVGGVTESDVMLARASNAIIIGFHVKPESKAAELAESQGVDVRLYDVIYDAVSDVRKAMEGLLEPTLQEVILGRVEVRQLFQVSKVGLVAGCFVTEGKIVRTALARVKRGGSVIFEGALGSLKRFKDDVKEVLAGLECGLSLSNFNDVQEGDVIESYLMEKVPTKLA